MTSTIGLRCYQITVHERGDTTPLSFDDVGLELDPLRFITNFVQSHATPMQHSERERSWYFEEQSEAGPGNSAGYVHYGTFGFESNLISYKTKKRNYRRKVDDVEEIPLFYEFWCPDDADHAFASFQSFQGRSCITLVMEKMQERFEAANPGHLMRFKKLIPNDSRGSLYANAPVKQLRFIKRNAPSDITDQYFTNGAPTEVDFEVSLTARRRRNLGMFGSLQGALSRDERTGFVTHEGVAFSEAIATIKVGKKYRPVGVFGLNTDAGVIDITEDIERGLDGHPTFESVQAQSDEILLDFHSKLSGGR